MGFFSSGRGMNGLEKIYKITETFSFSRSSIPLLSEVFVVCMYVCTYI